MVDTKNGKIIDLFFKALNKGDFNTCEKLLKELSSISKIDTRFDGWGRYFRGVLLMNRDLRLDLAATIFQDLLQQSNTLEPFLQGQVLLSVGNMFLVQGSWGEAIQFSQKALGIFPDLQKPEEQAKAWNQIAFAHYKGFIQGDFSVSILEESISYCESSLATLKALDSSDNNLTLQAHIWNTLGLIHGCLMRWDDATNCFVNVLKISTQQGNEFFSGFAYANLGEIYQRIGESRWQDALEAYQNALDIFFKFEDDYQAVEVAANIGFLHSEIDANSEAIHHYAMAIGLIESLRSGVSTEAARSGFFATVTDTFANTILTCIADHQYSQAFEYMEQACSRTFLDLLDADSLELTDEINAETVTLSEVQWALPDDVLLLEYFTTGLLEARDSSATAERESDRHRFPPEKTLIFAITNDDIQIFDAGISPNKLYPSRRDAAIEEYFLEPRMLRALYTFLISPAEESLVGKKRIYIVPHGPLHYVPFQALVAPNGEALLRQNGPQLIYAPSATVLLRNVVQNQPVPTARTEEGLLDSHADDGLLSCLAIGYNGGLENPLLYAEAEAQQIARMMRGASLSGDHSVKERVLQAAANCKWLHFSCHGSFAPDDPLQSALTLSETETLTAQEVLEKLTLRCDLVSLSACESGLSQVRRGDELFGLVRAFIYAGTRALVVTQWKVEELSTRIVMERFYRNHLTWDGLCRSADGCSALSTHADARCPL